jgi:DNA-directed RNA polymerase specialized sigma24 family protein
MEVLYSKYNQRLRFLCRRFDPIYYEDWAQDIWVKLMALDKELTWALISKIATNYCIDMIRKQKVREGIFSQYYEPEADIFHDIDFRILNAKEQAIIEQYLAGFKLKEISYRLSIPYGTITNLFSKVIVKLRNDLMRRRLIDINENTNTIQPRIYKRGNYTAIKK